MSQEQIRIRQEPGPVHKGTIRIEREPVRVEQGPVVRGPFEDRMSADLQQLRTREGELNGRVHNLEVRKSVLTEQSARLGADADPSAVKRDLTTVEHDLMSTQIELEMVSKKIQDLVIARDMARVGITVQPSPGRDLEAQMARERMAAFGGIVLLLPLVLAFARRIWHRGAPRASFDIDDSPRLQRMEQAIESIALEVERIGEAQRFTTKLLTERHPDAARLGVTARRDPGTITPH